MTFDGAKPYVVLVIGVTPLAQRVARRVGMVDKPSARKQHTVPTPLLGGAAIDLSGNLFVADAGNLHVQKCTPTLTGYTCSKFAGTTGETDSDFDHLSPVGVAVDRKGKVYVADGGDNQRIQVFSAAGAYLTTLGGGENSLNSGFSNLAGVAVGADGTVTLSGTGTPGSRTFRFRSSRSRAGPTTRSAWTAGSRTRPAACSANRSTSGWTPCSVSVMAEPLSCRPDAGTCAVRSGSGSAPR